MRLPDPAHIVAAGASRLMLSLAARPGRCTLAPLPWESILIPQGGWHLSAQPLWRMPPLSHQRARPRSHIDARRLSDAWLPSLVSEFAPRRRAADPRTGSAHTRHSDSVPIAHASLTHCPATRHPCGGGVAPDMRRRPDAMRDMLHEHAAIPHKARRGVVNARAPPLTVVAKGEEVGSQKQPRPASTRGAIGNPAGACARATQQCAWFLD